MNTHKPTSLYEKIISIDNLYEAYLKSRKGKRNRNSVIFFENDLGANILELHNELKEGKYTVQPYKEFSNNHRRKPRLVIAPTFRDVVVQQAIYKIIYPIFDKKFIFDNYGCRVGKGTHRAAERAQKFLRQSMPESYTLKLDIKKFYDSIQHDNLEKLVRKVIKENKLVELIMMYSDKRFEKGMPIGNLISQLAGLIILNPFDHYIKRNLKIRKYIRYVDDMVLFDLTKEKAYQLKMHLEKWLNDNLKMKFSRYFITPVKRGINFVGYRTWKKIRLIRKHSLYNFTKALRLEKINSLTSLIGHALKTSTYTHYKSKIQTEKPHLSYLVST